MSALQGAKVPPGSGSLLVAAFHVQGWLNWMRHGLHHPAAVPAAPPPPAPGSGPSDPAAQRAATPTPATPSADDGDPSEVAARSAAMHETETSGSGGGSAAARQSRRGGMPAAAAAAPAAAVLDVHRMNQAQARAAVLQQLHVLSTAMPRAEVDAEHMRVVAGAAPLPPVASGWHCTDRGLAPVSTALPIDSECGVKLVQVRCDIHFHRQPKIRQLSWRSPRPLRMVRLQPLPTPHTSPSRPRNTQEQMAEDKAWRCRRPRLRSGILHSPRPRADHSTGAETAAALQSLMHRRAAPRMPQPRTRAVWQPRQYTVAATAAVWIETWHSQESTQLLLLRQGPQGTPLLQRACVGRRAAPLPRMRAAATARRGGW